MKCTLCDRLYNRMGYEVLGEQIPFCDVHAVEWEKIGPMATMIAFILHRLDHAADAELHKVDRKKATVDVAAIAERAVAEQGAAWERAQRKVEREDRDAANNLARAIDKQRSREMAALLVERLAEGGVPTDEWIRRAQFVLEESK